MINFRKSISQASFPFFIAGALIGVLLIFQLKSAVQPESSYPLDEYEFQKSLIESFVQDQQELQTQLTELQAQVDEAEAKMATYSFADSEYFQTLQSALGLTELSGSGVEIILEDSETISRDDWIVDSNGLVHASDLRDLINLLRTFPIIGLSINDQRIVTSTPITSAGNTILINNFNVVPPFKIQVLTDIPDLVLQKLSSENDLPLLYTRVVKYGIQFKFKKNESLTLPAYIGGYSTQFITALAE